MTLFCLHLNKNCKANRAGATLLELYSSCVIVYSFVAFPYTNTVTAALLGGNSDHVLTSIGKNIRKFRHARSLRLEDLAEKAGLSVNYMGALERGEKFPSLGSFILIANALEVSADLLLADVLTAGYTVKESLLAEKLDGLSVPQRNQVYTVLDALLQTIQ